MRGRGFSRPRGNAHISANLKLGDRFIPGSSVEQRASRIGIRIDQLVLVENKTVEKILPIHLAQLLTYLKLSGLSLGLIINWSVILLRDGIQRVVRNHPEELGVG